MFLHGIYLTPGDGDAGGAGAGSPPPAAAPAAAVDPAGGLPAAAPAAAAPAAAPSPVQWTEAEFLASQVALPPITLPDGRVVILPDTLRARMADGIRAARSAPPAQPAPQAPALAQPAADPYANLDPFAALELKLAESNKSIETMKQTMDEQAVTSEGRFQTTALRQAVTKYPYAPEAVVREMINRAVNAGQLPREVLASSHVSVEDATRVYESAAQQVQQAFLTNLKATLRTDPALAEMVKDVETQAIARYLQGKGQAAPALPSAGPALGPDGKPDFSKMDDKTAFRYLHQLRAGVQ